MDKYKIGDTVVVEMVFNVSHVKGEIYSIVPFRDGEMLYTILIRMPDGLTSSSCSRLKNQFRPYTKADELLYG